MKRKGFTLAEVLVMLVFIGLIAILSIQTVKTGKTKFAFSCYHFLRDLKIVAGHMGASTVAGNLNSFSCESAQEAGTSQYTACVTAGEAGGATAEADTYILDYRTGTGFCKGIAKYMGTATKIECATAKLNSATLSAPYGTISSGKAENFRLMNGYLIYISNKVTPATGTPYRILSVDFNGEAGPNVTGNDILSFAIFDNGEVLPLDEAATNPKFFNTAIKMRNIAEMPDTDAAKQTVINSMRHPAAIIRTSDKKPLSFKDAYCRVLGTSPVDSTYCSGYTSFSEKFKFIYADTEGNKSTVMVPVTICTQAKYNANGTPAQTVNGEGFVAECEFTVLKPQVSKFIPATQDVYSSVNNEEDVDSGSGEANQIYQY